jgi:hypothetical protein
MSRLSLWNELDMIRAMSLSILRAMPYILYLDGTVSVGCGCGFFPIIFAIPLLLQAEEKKHFRGSSSVAISLRPKEKQSLFTPSYTNGTFMRRIPMVVAVSNLALIVTFMDIL